MKIHVEFDPADLKSVQAFRAFANTLSIGLPGGESTAPPEKKGPGRPAGSTNKPKPEPEQQTIDTDEAPAADADAAAEGFTLDEDEAAPADALTREQEMALKDAARKVLLKHKDGQQRLKAVFEKLGTAEAKISAVPPSKFDAAMKLFTKVLG